MIQLVLFPLPVLVSLTTMFSSVLVLRYLRIFGRKMRKRTWPWVLLFSLCNGTALGIMLSGTVNFSQQIPIIIFLMSVALVLENNWLADMSIGATVMLGNSILQNYLSLYFICCAVFRLMPWDNYFRSTKSYRTFGMIICNIACAAIVVILRRWFPNEELKISLYSKSYSPLLRIWLPLSNTIVILCTLVAMPHIWLYGLSRPVEIAFFVILLGWMISSLAASYLIALVQCWRVHQNERANIASMTLRATRQDFMLTYLVNLSSDEFMKGRELFHIDGRFYSEMRRQFLEECVHPKDAASFLEEISRPGHYESMLLNSPCYEVELRCNRRRLMDMTVLPEEVAQKFSEKHDDYVWLNVQCIVTQSVWGELLLNVGFKDITEAKLRQLKLQRDAKTQPLTGLMNRREWERQVRKRLADGGGGLLAVVDLDHFKDVNDNLGHLAGDQILKETAQMLSRAFRVNDLVGHIGGDEFCVFAESFGEGDMLHRKMNALLEQRRKSYVGKDGKRKSLSFSIGIALSPEHGYSLDELLSHADMALYQAKEAGRDCYRIFSR